MNNYLQHLEETFRERWHEPVLYNYGGETLTYGRIGAHIAALHLLFDGLGLREGERVAVSGAPSARRSVTMLAVLTYGTTAVCLPHGSAPQCCPLLLADGVYFAALGDEQPADLRCAVAIDDFGLLHAADPVVAEACRDLEGKFDTLYIDGLTPSTLHFRPVADAAQAIIAPDGLVLSYSTLCHSIAQARQSYDLSASDSVLALLPPCTPQAVVDELLLPLLVGCPIHYVRSGTDLGAVLGAVRPTVVDSVAEAYAKRHTTLRSKPLLRHLQSRKNQAHEAAILGGRVRYYI